MSARVGQHRLAARRREEVLEALARPFIGRAEEQAQSKLVAEFLRPGAVVMDLVADHKPTRHLVAGP